MWYCTLFPRVLNMSLTAAIAIVLVLLARLLLKRAPKVLSYALWAVVLFRLICPISFSSEFSLYGIFDSPAVTGASLSFVPADAAQTETPLAAVPLQSVVAAGDTPRQSAGQTSARPLEAPMAIATLVWLIGFAAMLVYSAASVLILKKRLKSARCTAGNIYEAGNLKTPFVLGVFRPRIYIPEGLAPEEKRYIILHEQTHIRRFDHIMKPFAFLVLSVHWFNPLVWIAFVFMGTDMELACDERVIKEMGGDIRRAYSASLLSLATGRHILNGGPLAFGEGNVGRRIRNVLNFKKPAAWVVAASAVLVAALGAGLAVNPPDGSGGPEGEIYRFPSYLYDRVIFDTDAEAYSASFGAVTASLTNKDMDSGLMCGKSFTLVKQSGDEWRIVPFAEGTSFYAVAIGLAVGESETYTLTPDMLEGGLDPGNYRIVTDVWYADEMPPRTTHSVWAEFSVTEGDMEISMADIRRLAQKGDGLSFGDFSNFYGVDAGSSLDYHILVYGVEGLYRLIVHTDGKKLDSVNLESIWEEGGSGIDIRYGDIDTFIKEHPSAAEDGSGYVEEQTEALKTGAAAQWSCEQAVGADMAALDYASDDIIIFHGYFGLFVYELNSRQLVRSLDLSLIGCDATQGDGYCEVFVSADGNTVQLHPVSSEAMYVYTVSDNTLYETAFRPMENRFGNTVSIDNVFASESIGSYSYRAVKFDTGEYGYLHTSDWTLGTLVYMRGDTVYNLFEANTGAAYTEEDIRSAMACVKAYFSKEAANRILDDLWFDEAACRLHRISYMQYGKGKVNGVTEDNVIVLLCDFTIENDKTFNGSYINWKMILIRDDAGGAWRVDDQGV